MDRIVAKQARGFVLHPADSDAWWFLGSRMRRLAGIEDSDGTFSLLEQTAPPGFAPPQHVHHDENEAFYVLEGSMRVTCGDDVWTVAAGDFVSLPRHVWHGFTVSDEGVRILHLTAPAQFERLVAEVGERATEPGFRTPDATELSRLTEALPRYGIEAAD